MQDLNLNLLTVASSHTQFTSFSLNLPPPAPTHKHTHCIYHISCSHSPHPPSDGTDLDLKFTSPKSGLLSWCVGGCFSYFRAPDIWHRRLRAGVICLCELCNDSATCTSLHRIFSPVKTSINEEKLRCGHICTILNLSLNVQRLRLLTFVKLLNFYMFMCVLWVGAASSYCE